MQGVAWFAEADASANATTASLNECLQPLDQRRRDCIVYAFVEG